MAEKIGSSPADGKKYSYKRGGNAPRVSTANISTPPSDAKKYRAARASGEPPKSKGGAVDISKKFSAKPNLKARG